MPTFDFSNIIKKIVSVGISAVASPVVWVLAAAGTLSAAVGYYTTWFDSISVPSVESITSFNFDSQILQVLMYAVNADFLATIITWVFNTVINTINFLIQFLCSMLVVLLGVGVASVIRKSLKDWQ